MGSRRIADPALVLLVALLATHLAVTLAFYDHPVMPDEAYWIQKASYLTTHGRFAPIAAENTTAEAGRSWGTSDWRPQLYTPIVALLGGDTPDLRLRTTLLAFVLLGALLVTLFLLARRAGVPRYAAALLLGVAPWPFEFVQEIGPDALNAFAAGVGLLLLWRWIADARHGVAWLFGATVVMAATLLLRPDMIVMVPIVIGLTFVLRRPTVRELVAGAAAFAIVVGAQVAYRASVTGRPGIYGGLALTNRGAFRWADTWPGTEKEAYDFVYAISGGSTPPPLPSRAFADAAERQRVEALVARIESTHRYTPEDDAAFEQLARERTRRHPLRVASLRLWHAAHLWLNVETPTPLLMLLAPLPRAERRPIFGALLALRLACYALAVAATARAVQRWHRGTADAFDQLTLLLAGFVVARTLLVGVGLNWKVHRYVLSAWPPLLWCACAALRPRPLRGAGG